MKCICWLFIYYGSD